MSEIIHKINQNSQNYIYTVCFVLGIVSGFSFFHIPFLWFLFVAGVTALCYLVQFVRLPFVAGYLFGLGQSLVSFYWIGAAFQVVDMGWLGPIATLALSASVAVFTGLSLWGVRYFKEAGFFVKNPKIQTALAFTSSWVCFEWLRSQAFSGFPWNLVGHLAPLELLQIVPYLGIHGLSFICMGFATSFYTKNKKYIGGWSLAIGLACFYGFWRLSVLPDPGLTNINMRLVQPCLEQSLKFNPLFFNKNVQREMALSMLEGEKPLDMVIWPEDSLPTVITNDSAFFAALKEAAPPNGYLIFGSTRKFNKDQHVSLFVIDDKGKLCGYYDKHLLVPFGEYAPFKDIINIRKLTHGWEDFKPSSKHEVINLFSKIPPFAPLICYEAVFPGVAAHALPPYPQWILTITNDAWFGVTRGPLQHLYHSRIRAIEEGLPLVRCANNGISAVIDAKGRIIHQLETNKIGFIDFTLPKPLPESDFLRQLPFKKGMWLVGLLVSMLILGWLRRAYYSKKIK